MQFHRAKHQKTQFSIEAPWRVGNFSGMTAMRVVSTRSYTCEMRTYKKFGKICIRPSSSTLSRGGERYWGWTTETEWRSVRPIHFLRGGRAHARVVARGTERLSWRQVARPGRGRPPWPIARPASSGSTMRGRSLVAQSPLPFRCGKGPQVDP